MNKLAGKTIFWLGSSVTYGWASGRITMAEYIAERNGAICVKEAVSGTTLYSGEQCYTDRLEKFDKNAKADAFICQISTNDVKDAEGVKKMGEIGRIDRATTLGAVEYIINYVKSVWGCPIIFYSGTKYGGDAGESYGRLVNEIKKLEKKRGIYVLDLYHDEKMNDIPPELYNYYMADPVHPKAAGYLEWWTPKFEEALNKVL